MKPASILTRQQVGFGLAALVMAFALAAFMDSALRNSLEHEDALVMDGQARAILGGLAAGDLPVVRLPLLRPEKTDWRLLDHQGHVLSESPGMARIPVLDWPEPDRLPQEREDARGGTYSVASRRWACPDGAHGLLLLAMDRTHEDMLVRDFRRTLGLGVLGVALLSAFVGRWVARWGLAPLHRIAQETGQIDDRSLDRRLDPAAFPRELQELVATLNATLERLDAAFQRLDRFGAELAHELRTPLQNLRSTLENLAVHPGSTPRQQHELGGLLEECDRMGALIEQILFLARAEGPAERRPVPAAGLLEETRAFFEAAAEEGGVALEVEDPGDVVLSGDPLLLLRALHNLVSNALRHTPRGGRVRMGAGLAGGGATLWVEDTGEGIPAAWLGRLGTPFLRGPGAERSEGLGLGLALVRRIALMHGGELVLASAEGQGTRADLRLPAP